MYAGMIVAYEIGFALTSEAVLADIIIHKVSIICHYSQQGYVQRRKGVWMDRKLFVFDVGGVVIYNNPIIEEFCEKYGLEFRSVFRDWMGYHNPLMEGYLSVTTFLEMIENKYNIDLHGDNVMLSCYHPREIPAVTEMVRRLRQNGHRVVTGSNTFDVHWEKLKNMTPSPLRDFDKLYASHEIHLSKPDHAFYHYIMKAESFEPSNSFFIDDMEKNVQAARDVGMTAYKYDGNDSQLLEFLSPYLEKDYK